MQGKISYHCFNKNASYQAMRRLLDLNDERPTAVFICSDTKYADFKNAAYQLTLSYTAGSVALSNCTFTSFGYTSDSRALTAYHATGAVTVANSSFTGAGQNGIGVYCSHSGTNVAISGNSFNSCRVGIRCYAATVANATATFESRYCLHSIRINQTRPYPFW